MTRLLSIVAAIAAVMLLPAVASAHTATSECGGFLTLDRGSRTADILRTDTDPDQLIHDDVAGNGTYAVVPGTYRVNWSDGYTIRNLEVEACPNQTPTPTPSPTPTPTPSASPSPTVTPSPTVRPSPSPVATPSAPVSTPTPTPVSTPAAPTPTVTLPPTDRVDAAVAQTSTALLVVAVLVMAFALGFAVVSRRLRDRER